MNGKAVRTDNKKKQSFGMKKKSLEYVLKKNGNRLRK